MDFKNIFGIVSYFADLIIIFDQAEDNSKSICKGFEKVVTFTLK